MTPSMAYLLLGTAQTIGLLLLPIWVGGIWLQLGALALFAWATGFELVGDVPLAILLALTLAAEIAEAPLAAGRIPPAFRRRGGIGALVGGAGGALAGLFFPLMGSLFGALAGAAAGAGIAAIARPPERAGCIGAGGQAFALALRSTAAVGIAAFAFYSLSAR